VNPERVRVLFKQGVLLIVGEKPSPYAGGTVDASFHLVERGFGRFARAVHLDGPVDGGRARAVFRGGELRITLPRVVERRGAEIHVPITTA